MKLSIIIPYYNEAENVPKLLNAYAEAVIRPDIEVILVNNGSTDNTADVLAQLLPQYESFLKVVTVPTNQGYEYGIFDDYFAYKCNPDLGMLVHSNNSSLIALKSPLANLVTTATVVNHS